MDHDSEYPAVVRGLRAAGIDVLLTIDSGGERWPDERQLRFAHADERVIITANTGDFARLHALWLRSGESHSGIAVRADQQMPVGAFLRALKKMCKELSAERMTNRFEYLADWAD